MSRTICDLITRPRVILESSIGIVPVDGETTGRTIRVNRPDDENAKCKGSRTWGSPKISLNPRHDLQDIQRPTPSHLGKNEPSLPGLGDADMHEAVAAGVISATRNFLIKYPIM